MKSLATLTRVEAALLAREPAAVAFTLLLPLILLVLNGSGGNEPNPTFGGAGTVDVLMAGYLVYVMATSAIMEMAGNPGRLPRPRHPAPDADHAAQALADPRLARPDPRSP